MGDAANRCVLPLKPTTDIPENSDTMSTNVNAIGAMLTAPEVALMMGMNRNTVVTWTKKGLIPAVQFKKNGHYRYQRAAIEKLIAKHGLNYDVISDAK